MSKPLVSVLYAPGTNSHRETMWAFERVGARTELLFLSEVLAGKRRLGDTDALCIPGGFAHGDHLGAGTLAGQLLRNADTGVDSLAGTPLLAICNGFQIGMRSGLFGEGMSLTANESGTFRNIIRQPHIVQNSNCVWLKGMEGQTVYFPCAHGEGRLVTSADASPIAALRYPADANPDGSVDDIAGITSPDGMFLGLMDHPERTPDEPGTLDIFANGIAACR